LIRFEVYRTGEGRQEVDLFGSYLIGADDLPLRAEIEQVGDQICCKKNSDEAAALGLLWPVPRCGKVLLETTRLPDRDKPYNLNVELARCRLMRVAQKQEDWGLYDYPNMDRINEALQQSRDWFIKALQSLDSPAEAAALADKSLQLSMQAGEDMAVFHAQLFLTRRKQAGSFSRRLFGCQVDVTTDPDKVSPDKFASFDFVTLGICWRDIEPQRQQYNFQSMDRWVQFLVQRRIPIRIASLVRLDRRHLPQWLFAEASSFDAVRDLIFEHIANIAKRYGKYVRGWNVASSFHAENPLGFNFEQLLELTRLASLRAKQVCPRAAAIVEITFPWGQYYGRNPRTIHPLLYADMVAQSGVNFDAFGLEILFETANEDTTPRDLLQISAMIDKFSMLGKPLHLTVAVPSAQAGQDGGYWLQPWDDHVQAQWIKAFYPIALSKPLVESVTWGQLWDDGGRVRTGGLLGANMAPKASFDQFQMVRRQLRAQGRPGRGRQGL